MNSRERLFLSLSHKEPDRIPIDLNGSNQTGITSSAYKVLLNYMGIKEEVEIIEQIQQLANVNSKILDTFGVDTIKFTANPPSNWKFKRYEDNENYYFDDEWSMTWRMPKRSPRYFDFYKPPLAKLSLEEIKKFKWPDPDDKERFKGLKEKAEVLFKTNNKALIAAHPNGPGIFEEAWWITGLEEFFVNMIFDKKKTNYVLNKITEIYIKIWDNYLDEIGEFINVCILSEDLGTQSGPIISHDLFKEMIKPLLKKHIESIKKKTKAKVYLHSCGDVSKFIPDLIDTGVDILNPIQVSASNMSDTAKLKREYGRDLTFWGASCDPQRILSFGSVKEVKEEVKKRINDLAPGGGFVLAPIHNIQGGVPPENIVALFETALEFGKY